MWVTWTNFKRKEIGVYTTSDLSDTINFNLSITDIFQFSYSIYQIKEINSGLIYIGKAKSVGRRINSHRLHILKSIAVFKNTKVTKMFSKGTLHCHIELAKEYIKLGNLNIEVSIIYCCKKEKYSILKVEAKLIKEGFLKYGKLLLNKTLF